MSRYITALDDVIATLINVKLPIYLAWADIKQRYRRSSLGPFWITIATGVRIATIGIIFGGLFSVSLKDFFPYLSAGIIIWIFFSTVLVESTTAFTDREAVIKQLPLPLFTHVLRMIILNFYIFLHNLIIIPPVLIFVQRSLTIASFLFIPGLLLVVLNLTWMSLILSITCARFRDLSQIIQSVLQVFFYITPVIWMPISLPPGQSRYVLEPNPFFHLMELLRAPIMGESPSMFSWSYCFVMFVIGGVASLVLFNKYKNRVAYWL